ncbi:MAG TPA: hypothetical protein VG795_14940 [Acidimicrobiia bacterium]|nr:hypothetical protein [Acidimicrobiia bacterium]
MMRIVVLSVAFGFTSKFADLCNEHGVRWFRGADLALGAVWGAAGAALVLTDPAVGAVVVATTLYWFLRVKLEYPNHALAGVLIMLAALALDDRRRPDFLPVLGLLTWLAASGYVNTYLKESFPLPEHRRLHRFLRLRLRYYAGPLVYALCIHRVEPLASTIAGFLGTEVLTVWFARRFATGEELLVRSLGIVRGHARVLPDGRPLAGTTSVR